MGAEFESYGRSDRMDGIVWGYVPKVAQAEVPHVFAEEIITEETATKAPVGPINELQVAVGAMKKRRPQSMGSEVPRQ